MPYDATRSPVGWYLCSYLCRFVELSDRRRNDPEARFTSWENTVLIRASSMQLAFAKVVKIGKAHAAPYLGGPEPGVRVAWEFVGVTDVLPIYEALQDGAEVAWTPRAPRKLRRLKQLVRNKSSFVGRRRP